MDLKKNTCPHCGQELQISKKDPNALVCYNCKKIFKSKQTVEEVKAAPAKEVEAASAKVNPAKSVKPVEKKKKKKGLVIFMGILLVLLIAVAAYMWINKDGESKGDSDKSSSYEEPTLEYVAEKGTLVFAGVEKANEDLTEEENAYVVKFEFTNNDDQPRMGQEIFGVTFAQNDKEDVERPSWSSSGGEQYDWCSELYETVSEGKTTTYAYLVKLKSKKPLTITVKENYNSEAEKKTIEIDVNALGE